MKTRAPLEVREKRLLQGSGQDIHGRREDVVPLSLVVVDFQQHVCGASVDLLALPWVRLFWGLPWCPLKGVLTRYIQKPRGFFSGDPG